MTSATVAGGSNGPTESVTFGNGSRADTAGTVLLPTGGALPGAMRAILEQLGNWQALLALQVVTPPPRRHCPFPLHIPKRVASFTREFVIAAHTSGQPVPTERGAAMQVPRVALQLGRKKQGIDGAAPMAGP